MSIPEKILQAGCDAYAATFLNGNGSLGDGIESAYLAINHHDDWVRPGPPAWTGEGLPPVGTVCEFEVETDDWRQCEVVAVKNDYAICWIHVNKIFATGGASVRPIRTPEQIAAEEREKAIAEMVYGGCGCDQSDGTTTAFVICRLLYDAGYRKQVSE